MERSQNITQEKIGWQLDNIIEIMQQYLLGGNGEYEAYTVQVPYTETITHSEGNYEIQQRGAY